MNYDDLGSGCHPLSLAAAQHYAAFLYRHRHETLEVQTLARALLTLARPLCLVLLAEVAVHVGQIEEGLRLVAEALAAFECSGRGDLLAEAYRLQGVLLLCHPVADVAGLAPM